MAISPSPLTSADLQALDNAQRELRGALEKIEKAEACGIDCQVFRQMYEDTNQRIDKFREVYSQVPPAIGR